jgi:predicted dienelactone hydrolase
LLRSFLHTIIKVTKDQTGVETNQPGESAVLRWIKTVVVAGCCCLMWLTVAVGPSARADDGDGIQIFDLQPNDAARDRVVPVRVYRPQHPSPLPVILFSHGLGGSRENNAYLGKHWAAGGYVCVFMQHAGSDQDVWKSERIGKRLSALRKAASLSSFQSRVEDVSFVIDQLQRWNERPDHPLGGKLDLEQIGMSGHSFGAVTTLAVAGRRYPLGRSFAEKRIDAFLAMSPQAGKGLSAERAFTDLAVPILCMTGSEDDSPIDDRVTPESRREVFAALPDGDKYELVFDRGHHFAFSDAGGFRARDRDPSHHPAIQKISLKFWNAYLKNDEQAKQWLQSDQPNTDCDLKQTDVWQWK